MRKLLRNKWALRFTAAVVSALALPIQVWAAGPPVKSELDNPLTVTLLVVIGALLLAIALLAHVVIGAAQLKVERFKKDKAAAAAKVVSVLLLCLFTTGAFAQAAAEPAAATETVSTTINGLSYTSFYALLTVIGLELLIILWMLWFLRSFIAKEYAIEVEASAAAVKESVWKKWWIKINSFRSLNEEQDIDLGHDYDNIRELDNKLPPWWLYGFYVTIIFAGIYLWRYHVAHSAPLSIQEYENSVAKSEEEKAEFLKKAGNAVDETTVKLLTDASDIEAGKKLFTTGACIGCHAADGGGGVGPNLTDEYWIHGGNIKDVFKTIKYGWPDKGMQSWKGSYTPQQIAQIASFIKSIQGTKVANPKPPQGELYKETAAAADTTKIAAAKQ